MDKEQIFKLRLKRVRRQLRRQRVDFLLVSAAANVTYLTGFLGDDSWALLTPRTVYLLTDSRYTEQALNQCPGCRIIERREPMTKAVAKLLRRMAKPIDKYELVKSLAVESSISIAQLGALKKTVKKRIKPLGNVIEAARRTKDDYEISTIKKAARIASRALAGTLRFIKPGITESELAGEIELQIRKLGAKISFETIVAFGPNAARPHHNSGKRKLRKNDSVLIDFGVKVTGYCCDMTRCFPVGKPGWVFDRAYKAVHEAQSAAISKVKAGVSLKTVDQAARKVISEYGFEPHGHGTGHGLGLEVHELPVVGPNSKGRLQAGDVITIEPGIYIPGKLGIRIEDDVLVTETGCKILTDISR
jgi:Xaa-Pro aminopeptidase